MSACGICAKTLGTRNVCGYCQRCQNKVPDLNAKRRAGSERYFSDPAKLHEHRLRFKAAARSEHAKQIRSETAKRIGLWSIGRDVQLADPTTRKRAGQKVLPNKLARLGVPREQWETYRALMQTKRIRSHEAVQMCMDKHELEMVRFRREIMGARAA